MNIGQEVQLYVNTHIGPIKVTFKVIDHIRDVFYILKAQDRIVIAENKGFSWQFAKPIDLLEQIEAINPFNSFSELTQEELKMEADITAAESMLGQGE